MNFFLFGSGGLLMDVAAHLRSKGREPLLVCAGRHLNETFGKYGSFAEYLNVAGINYRASTDANTDLELSSLIGPRSCGFSLGAAWIFKQHFIDRFDLGLYNMHNARLPENRGGGGFSWRIMRGDRDGACTIHRVSPSPDSGPVVRTNEFTFPNSCRIPGDFIDFTADRARAMLLAFFDDILAGKPIVDRQQDESRSTYWPRLDTEVHGYIDWSWHATEVERFVCAFDDPYAGASTFIGEKRVRLKKAAQLINGQPFHSFQSGIIYRKSENELIVACNDKSIAILSANDDDGTDLLPRLRVGDRFHTPEWQLERSRATRVYYHPAGKSLSLKPRP